MRRKGKIVNRKKYQNGRSLFRWISTGMNKTIDPYMESVMADAISLASDHKICEYLAETVEEILYRLEASFITSSVALAAFEIVANSDYERAEWLIKQKFG